MSNHQETETMRITESQLRQIVRQEITEMAGDQVPEPIVFADSRPRRPRGKGVAAIVRMGHLLGRAGAAVRGAGGMGALQREWEAVATAHGCQARPHRTSEITLLVRLYGPTREALVACVEDMQRKGLGDLEGMTPEQAVAEGMGAYRP